MAGVRHAIEDVSAFLDGNYCQVWAVDRRTGEYQYLPDGKADDYRAEAKRHWKCPVPDCTGPINTRGKSRRAHFYHLNTVDHAAESEAHLAAKAMLFGWARSVVPGGCEVHEELTIKDRDQAIHRRPDVAITDGQRTVALEVEYKNFQPESWRAKQANYDQVGIVCSWLLGHTQVTRVHDSVASDGATEVKVSKLGKVIGAAGHHVLVINPTDQLVGTLAGDRDFTSRLTATSPTAWLWIHRLDDCQLDPSQGLITPGTQRIDTAIEERRRAAEAARRRQEDETKRRAESETRDAEYAARRAEFIRRKQKEQDEAWLASTLHATCLERWGRVPDVLTARMRNPGAAFASEAHWHAVVYEALLHDSTKPFRLTDVERVIRQTGLPLNPDTKQRFRSLMQFFEHLAHAGLLRIDRSKGIVLTPASHNIGAKPQRRRTQDVTEQAATTAPPVIPTIPRLSQTPGPEPPTEAATRWTVSAERLRLISRFNRVPEFVAWRALTEEEFAFIDATPEHWHAIIYLNFIDGRPHGHLFSIDDIVAELAKRTIDASSPLARAAIRGYLRNLTQRRFLVQAFEDTFTLASDF